MPAFKGVWRALAAGRRPGGTDASAAANGAAPAAAGPDSALSRLLATPTPARVLRSCVPPDAESQLFFMLTQVLLCSRKLAAAPSPLHAHTPVTLCTFCVAMGLCSSPATQV